MVVFCVPVGIEPSKISPVLNFDEYSYPYFPAPEEYESTTSETYRSILNAEKISTEINYIVVNGEKRTDVKNITAIKNPMFDECLYSFYSQNNPTLNTLSSGDIIGFYTNMGRSDTDNPINKYLIGFFNVQKLVCVPDLGPDRVVRKYRLLYGKNIPHTLKRYIYTGDEYHLSDLIIVKGGYKSRLLSDPFSITEVSDGDLWLDREFSRRFTNIPKINIDHSPEFILTGNNKKFISAVKELA